MEGLGGQRLTVAGHNSGIPGVHGDLVSGHHR
jgi:hypothetical protein